MAVQTVFIVQAFLAKGSGLQLAKGSGLQAEKPMLCRNSEDAIRRAKMLKDSKAGIVAYTQSGDAELGDHDEQPTILFKSGRLPPTFEE
jgi:hypothetical protein